MDQSAPLKSNFAAVFEKWWSSIHESAHAVAARHFGHCVEKLSLDVATIPHRLYLSPFDQNSCERLIISAAGSAATLQFCRYDDTGVKDDNLQIRRLRELGATDAQIDRMMANARGLADALVIQRRIEIHTVAALLRERQELNQVDVDRVMRAGLN
jgi:hypothetical protein